MMGNQITLYLDPIAYEKIIKDQETFKLGRIKSEILKKIIVNHYEKYSISIDTLKQKIEDTIFEECNICKFNNENFENIVWKLTKYLHENPVKNANKKNENKIKIHIRENKKDSELGFIIDSCPKNSSLSEFLANIIYSYLEEPQYEREKILFSDTINAINVAIKNNQSIRIKTKPENKIQHINPKEICVSKEGLYNYLLYQIYNDESKSYCARTIHIYNILNVHSDLCPRTFEPCVEEQFNKMKRNGVQFSINGNTIYKIKLTEKGKQLFKTRYLERPEPLKDSDVNKGIYYFDCSEMQFSTYFAPFRENIIILEPKEMVDEILKEYNAAINLYKG